MNYMFENQVSLLKKNRGLIGRLKLQLLTYAGLLAFRLGECDITRQGHRTMCLDAVGPSVIVVVLLLFIS